MAGACSALLLARPTQTVRNSMVRLCLYRQMLITTHHLGNSPLNTSRNVAFCELKRGLSLNNNTIKWMSMTESLLRKAAKPHQKHLVRVASMSISSGTTNNGNGDGNGGGADDDGGDGGLEPQGGNPVQEAATSATIDAIILDVGGMSCGGCAASVKRILESQPQVASASVNFATETAVILTIPEVRAIDNWKKVLGENLAKHLTSCGFTSSVRDTWNS